MRFLRFSPRTLAFPGLFVLLYACAEGQRGDTEGDSSTSGTSVSSSNTSSSSGAGGGQGGAGGGQGGDGGMGGYPMAACMVPTDPEWKQQTGADICAALGLACQGFAYHHDAMCGTPNPTLCTGTNGLSCCGYSMADEMGSEPNTSAQWTCGPACPPGSFESPTDPPKCVDVDECANGVFPCGAHAVCTNKPGSFTCTCDIGYTGDGFTCTPVPTMPACIASSDESWKISGAEYCAMFGLACAGSAYHHAPMCSTPNPTNTCGTSTALSCCSYSMADHVGSVPGDSALWTCQTDCPPGSEPNPQAGPKCIDIDECALGTDDCGMNATCTNEVGTFKCACDIGYTGDGKTCAPTSGPGCITSQDAAWSLTGIAYCALFGKTCTNSAYHHDATCTDPNPFLGCNMPDPAMCCEASMAGRWGTDPGYSGVWTCQ